MIETLEIAGVHGVAHDAQKRQDFSLWWETSIRSFLPFVAVKGIGWPSTGKAVVDSSRIIRDRRFRQQAIDQVAIALVAWRSRCSPTAAKVIVAHSMGTVIATAALRDCPTLCDVDVINIGSPITHPVYGRLLRRVGLGEPASRLTTTYQNWDDGICALGTPFGRWHTSAPKRWDVKPINVPGLASTKWPHEHDPELYFNHSDVKKKILSLAYSPRGVA